jgi:hypothetical protein
VQALPRDLGGEADWVPVETAVAKITQAGLEKRRVEA